LLSEARRHSLDLTLSISTPGQAVAIDLADHHRSSTQRLRRHREYPSLCMHFS
jgi:hypothetical protein